MGLLPGRLPRLKAPVLLRQAAIYAVSQFGSRAIPFLLLPVLTRYLSPADYGIVTMFLLTVLVLEPFVSLGLAGAFVVKFYDKTVDFPRYLWTCLSMVLGMAAFVWIVVFVARGPLGELTQVPSVWLLLAVPLVLARTIYGALLELFRVREQAVRYGIALNSQSLGLILLTVVLVAGAGLTWQGRLAAEVVGTIAFALVALLILWRSGWLRRGFVPAYGRHLIQFGVPLIPHTLGAVLMVQTDRLLLTNLVGVEETGLYTVGYQLALVIQLAALAFNSAYAPWLFRNMSEGAPGVHERLVRLTYVQFAAMGALALSAAFVMPWLGGILLGRDFVESGRFVGWFAIGFLFSGMYYMVTNYIFYAQQTRWLALVTISVAIVNIPLTYGLIQLNGGIGAAQALSISFALSFVLTWVVSQRVYPMPWFGGVSEGAARD